MTSDLTLDAAELDRMRLLFLERMPDFGEFTDSNGNYWIQEGAYKRELAKIAADTLPQGLFADTSTAVGARAVVAATDHVLKVRLKTIGRSQNLLGWRYSDFLRHLELKDARLYAQSMGQLLYGEGPTTVRVEAFAKAIWPLLRGTSRGNPYAQARLFSTLFLMLLYPQTDIAVRTDMFELAAKGLLGRRILRDAIFSAEEYENVLGFAAAVRNALEIWGWRPHDMMDVHSFLWITTRDTYEQEEW